MGDIHKNIFAGGLDYDASINSIDSTKLIESRNVLFSDVLDQNKFTALENIKGTTSLRTLSAVSGGRTMALFVNNYTIGGVPNVRCITSFSYSDNELKIQAYNPDTNILYSLYTGAVPVDYSSNSRTLDGVKYSEFGKDVIYFTDNYYPVRKLVCEIPSPYSPDFLSDADLELASKAAIGTISLDTIITGGSLLTGTYQLAYQLINPSSGKQTRFSLLTTPIHVYTTIDSIVRAGVGLPSNKKIRVDITPTSEELAAYTHFRLAVVENIAPAGVVQNEVGITPVAEIADYLTAGVIQNYEIISNTQYSSVLLDELVIDLAAIERVATLTVKEARLLLGNVTIKELDYDNGTPEITSGSVITQSGTGDSFSSDVFASRYKGHFRGEVYRFGISYFDDYGNYSAPVTLDLSGVTDNAISGSIDMKFPARNSSTAAYHILSTSNNTQSLGLRLTGIINHPTWARGFIICRPKRKKRVLFQSPFMPMAQFAGIGAIADYPSVSQQDSGVVNYPDASPMGPSSVFMPYNMFLGGFVEANTIVKPSGAPGPDAETDAGENLGLHYSVNYTHGLLFPPTTMYGPEPYTFIGNEQLSTVDAAITRLYATRFDSETYPLGEGANSSVSGTFFASLNNDYYWNAGAGVKPAIRASGDNMPVVANTTFDNYGEGQLIGGVSAWDKTKLETTGVPVGYPMETQRSVVVEMGNSRQVLGGPLGVSLTFASGAPVYAAYGGGLSTLDLNNYVINAGGLAADYINTVEIVNVITNQTDARYGMPEDYNEFIFTGTKVVFTPSELLDVADGVAVPKTVDVWGGDCVVSPHVFKVADTAYSVTNQQKRNGSSESTADLIDEWGKVWLNSKSVGISMPVPVKNASQYLMVVLESEYHGSVRDVDSYQQVTTQNFPILGCASESKSRTPLSYSYNINLNKENDQKIFVPKDILNILPASLPSRIYYTDIKVYQSLLAGFDKVRVLNYMDLPERFGKITKLGLCGDSLIAVQDDAISYIPVGEKVLEQTDASEIAVRSGDFLSTPLLIDSARGAQQLGAVLEVGNEMFIFDNRRAEIYKLMGRELRSITANNLSSYLAPTYPLIGQVANGLAKMWYDYNRNHLWFATFNIDGVSHIYNNKSGVWETALDFVPQSGVSSEGSKDLILAGPANSGELCLWSMYTGFRTRLFGDDVTPSVKFVVNPQTDFSKVFDSFLVTATNPVSLRLETRYPASTNQLSALVSTAGMDRGEGNYKIKTLRDTIVNPGARMRGTAGIVQMDWPTGASAPQALVESVVTQYRISQKVI